MAKARNLSDVRREYGDLSLDESEMPLSPFMQFDTWLAEAVAVERADPTAMVLSTVDGNGYPDSRVVLLKGIVEGSFIFYTNYQSTKAVQLYNLPFAALNFYWAEMARQVRVRGPVKRVSAQQSDEYFSSRPFLSQLSAMASKQSKVLKNREVLESSLNHLIQTYQQTSVVRPEYWGGFEVLPEEIEFWQGRNNRMHDRIQYFLSDTQKWQFRRLAP